MLVDGSEVSKMFIRSPYNYDRVAVSHKTGLHCDQPTLTVQSEAEEADINTIVKRFGLVGTMPSNPRVPMYGDFTDITDYRSALDIIREADEAFMELTPEVRSRFGNDPQQLMDFVADGKNLSEARELGLVPKEAAAPEPLMVRVVADPPPTK